jgi:signal peptidase I
MTSNPTDRRIKPTAAELGQLLFLTPKALAACKKLGFGPAGLRAFYVSTCVMEPTLMGPPNSASPNDADRLIFDTEKSVQIGPRHGEIWLFTPPCETSRPDAHFIQRVIGCPGDLVEVVPPRLTVDGEDVIRFMGDRTNGLEYNARRPVKMTEDGSIARFRDSSFDTLWVVCVPKHRLTRKRDSINLDGKRILEGWKWRKRSLGRIGASPLVRAMAIADMSGRLRLVAVRGEQLEFVPGHVVVNGVRLDEPYIEGPVKREAFFGRAIFRYFPPSRFGPLN